MPAALRWLTDLLPTNPLAARLVFGAGRRSRDMVLRVAVLGGLMALVMVPVLGSGSSMRDMAQSGATAFTLIAYGQLAAICLLTPLFMAGAIAQESNPRTWEILVTTPLNSLQIVLGNLAGRLFLALALLLSALPLCILVRLFGGVRSGAVVASLGVSALQRALPGQRGGVPQRDAERGQAWGGGLLRGNRARALRHRRHGPGPATAGGGGSGRRAHHVGDAAEPIPRAAE